MASNTSSVDISDEKRPCSSRFRSLSLMPRVTTSPHLDLALLGMDRFIALALQGKVVMAAKTEKAPDGFDTEFADELEQLEYYSHGDYVEVEITSVDRKDGDAAVVTFSPPLGDAFMKEMDIPIDPSTETEFTNLLRETGRNFTTASDIVGDRVPAKYTEDEWEIQYSEPKLSIKERARKAYNQGVTEENLKDAAISAAIIGAVLYWPISGILVSLLSATSSDDEDDPSISLTGAVMLYAIGTVIWTAGYTTMTWFAGLLGFTFPVEVTLLL